MSSNDGGLPITKLEPFEEEEEYSDDSQEIDANGNAPEATQVQKRKGGRKPIYATSEERKQRNRQAQAAFRERRTEYIKQLETTIKHHEDTLQSLQQSHRSAADECLMLRYKNSLLERILLEKGINVQAELQMKNEDSQSVSQSNTPSAVQRAVMNRHNQVRRTASTGATKASRPVNISSHTAPRSQPISSHSNSAIPRISPHDSTGKLGSSLDNGKTNARHMQSQQSRPQAPQSRSGQPSMTPSESHSTDSSNAAGRTSLYPSPYQAHMDQLEQEYDAQANMLDDDTPSDTSIGPGSAPGPSSFPQSFQQRQIPPGTAIPMGMQGQTPIPQPMHQMHQLPQQIPQTSRPIDSSNAMYGAIPADFDAYNQNLDADPFGLTASMHFPTQFTYQRRIP